MASPQYIITCAASGSPTAVHIAQFSGLCPGNLYEFILLPSQPSVVQLELPPINVAEFSYMFSFFFGMVLFFWGFSFLVSRPLRTLGWF